MGGGIGRLDDDDDDDDEDEDEDEDEDDEELDELFETLGLGLGWKSLGGGMIGLLEALPGLTPGEPPTAGLRATCDNGIAWA